MMQNALAQRVRGAAGLPTLRLAFSGVLGVAVLAAGAAVPSLVLGRSAASTAGAGRLELATLPAPTGPLTTASTVEELAGKMVGTNGAYRTLSAHLTSTPGDGRVLTDATLAVQQPDRFRVEASDGQRRWTAVSDGDAVWLHHPNGKVQARKNTGKLAPPVPTTDPRPDHVVVAQSGTDLPIGGMANTALHPYSVVQGVFPKAQVRITGTERVGGRAGVVVEVTPNPADPTAWAPKWGSRQAYVVDSQAGILLRAEQFGPDGALATRDVLSNVVVDDPAFAADFGLRLGNGERLLAPGEEP
jgi:outer membrane lipoprotein-sorting protein